MADIDGKVTITRRALKPLLVGGVPGMAARGQAAGQQLVQRDEALQAVRCLYFRAGETGVKWIPQVATSDLM